LFLVRRFLSPWWRRRQVPPKRRFLQEPHGVTTQKTPFFNWFHCSFVFFFAGDLRLARITRSTVTVLSTWFTVTALNSLASECFDLCEFWLEGHYFVSVPMAKPRALYQASLEIMSQRLRQWHVAQKKLQHTEGILCQFKWPAKCKHVGIENRC
jgi:hypothetical protein